MVLPFMKSVVVFMLKLLLVWGMPLVLLPEIIGYNLPDNFWAIIYLIVPPMAHITLIVLYYVKKHPLFALPLSHFIFPFFIFVVTHLIASLRITPGGADWVLSWMIISFIYFFSFAVITLIISTIIHMIRRRR